MDLIVLRLGISIAADGIRRKGRTSEFIENVRAIKALQGIDRSHVAVLLIDPTKGVTDQRFTPASALAARNPAHKAFQKQSRIELAFLVGSPVTGNGENERCLSAQAALRLRKQDNMPKTTLRQPGKL